MSRPNVLTIITHDMGQHLGCYGIDTVRTPSIDRLADEGVRFENAFCTSPQCSPSRAAFATGRYPHNNGVMGLTHSHFDWDLNPDERHVSDVLRDAGFHSSITGNQHETQNPAAVFDDELGGGGEHPEQLGERTATFLRESSMDEPFYHQLCIGRPHRDTSSPSGWGPMPDDYTPEATIPPYLQDSVRTEKAFGAMEGSIHRVDNAVGIVLDALEDTGQLENTIVTMTTDHGIPFPRAKCSPYDPGIEISLIMRWPERFTQGAVIDELVSNVDHLPTLCELLDIPTPDGVQGNSFVPLLTGSDEHTPRTELFGEMTFHDYCDPRRWIRTEDYKLIANFTHAPFLWTQLTSGNETPLPKTHDIQIGPTIPHSSCMT